MSADRDPNQSRTVTAALSRWADGVKRHPFMAGAAALIALVGTMSTLSGYGANLWSFYKTELTHRSAYETISLLDVGMGIDYVRTLLGTPTLTSDLQWNGLRESMFVAPSYMVQVVYGPDGRVGFYAVLALSQDFRPPIPNTDAKLGEHPYARIHAANAVVSVFAGASHGHYIERGGGSAVAGHRFLFLAYESHRGHEFDGVEVQYEALADLLDRIGADSDLGWDEYPEAMRNHDAWLEYRRWYRPNGYGVGEERRGNEWLESDSLFHYTKFGAGRTPRFRARY